RTLTGGLVYYAGRRVVPLGDGEAIRRFVDGGGRALVVRERKLDRVEAVTPVEERFRSRRGRRTLLLVTPRRVDAAR
ncbi:MAG: hypothetical protein QNK03_27470, partial [Myxococcota bacterium]|nr:hypothetical protein [Myxococcota bacterium]